MIDETEQPSISQPGQDTTDGPGLSPLAADPDLVSFHDAPATPAQDDDTLPTTAADEPLTNKATEQAPEPAPAPEPTGTVDQGQGEQITCPVCQHQFTPGSPVL
jgi:hypothetical protein